MDWAGAARLPLEAHVTPLIARLQAFIAHLARLGGAPDAHDEQPTLRAACSAAGKPILR